MPHGTEAERFAVGLQAAIETLEAIGLELAEGAQRPTTRPNDNGHD
jgi:hypothetical protein